MESKNRIRKIVLTILAIAVTIIAGVAMHAGKYTIFAMDDYLTPPGYSDHDYQALVTFALQGDNLTKLGWDLNELAGTDYSKRKGITWGTTGAGEHRLIELDISTLNGVFSPLGGFLNLTGDLDLSGCTALRSLNCSRSRLNSLDVSGCTELLVLQCSFNRLQRLNIENCNKLTKLSCEVNQLQSLEISHCRDLTELYCGTNELSGLDVRNCTKLLELSCLSNKLTSLDISKCTVLKYLWCQDNKIDRLDIRCRTTLIDLDCSENRLRELDLSECTALKRLWLSNNAELTNVNIIGCMELNTFYSSDNKLKSIYLSKDINEITSLLINTTKLDREAVILAPATPIRDGYDFEGWYSSAESMDNDFKFTFPFSTKETTFLYDRWTRSQCYVTFDSQGGGTIHGSPVRYDYDSLVTKPKDPVRAGCVFGGWYKERGCVKAWDFASDKIYKDITLYAKWTPDPLYHLTEPIKPKEASASSNAIQITWNTVKEADGYVVYRSITKEGPYRKVGTTKGTSFTDNDKSLIPGQTYYYKISAYITTHSGDIYSDYSSVITAKLILAKPAKPKPKAVSSSYNAIKITWSKVQGAEGYEVYRSTSRKGTYRIVKTTKASSYSDKKLSTNKAYYYKVRAYRKAGGQKLFGDYSVAASAKPILPVPKLLRANASKSGILLKWRKVDGAEGYVIYRSTSAKSGYKKIKTIKNKVKYSDQSLSPKKTYYYKVRTYRKAGQKFLYSKYSQAVKAKKK